MRSVPLRVPCPSPVRRPASSGGAAARSPFPRTWFWVMCPLVGGPLRPGRSGARGVGGGAGFVASSLGGMAGGPQGEGARSTPVRPSASLGRAPKRVSSASLSSWSAWSPYCPGSCPRADPGCGRRGAFACRCGTAALSRSLWEWAVGGVGAVAYGPSGAPPLVPRPSRGGAGGAPLAWRGGQRADAPLAGLQQPPG